jgi:Tol biopolymer transport system component
MAQPFDAGRLTLVGAAVPLAEHVLTISGAAVFSASPGVLAYRSGTAPPGRRLTWLDRQGNEAGAIGEPNSDNDIRLSPDQTRAAVVGTADRSTIENIWLIDFARGTRTRFTFDPHSDSPVWSPDGSQIFFSSGPKLETISEKAASGTVPDKELLNEPGKYHYPTSVSPDGRFLIYFTLPKPAGPGVSGETWALPLETHGQPIHLLGGQFSENRAVISPEGRWIAYRSNESGKFEIYVRSVVNSGSGRLSLGEGKWQAERGPGSPTPNLPVWRHDSKELFYLSTQDVIFSAPVNGSRGSPQLGNPAALFTAPCACGFDVSTDGRRFLVRDLAGAGGKTPITVVLNWQTELKAR